MYGKALVRIFFCISVAVIGGNCLDVTPAGSLPLNLYDSAAFYDSSSNSIVIAGGRTDGGEYQRAIYKYNIQTEEIALVANFSDARQGGRFGEDLQKNFYYIGGYKFPNDDDLRNARITKFSPETNYEEPVDVATVSSPAGFPAIVTDPTTGLIYVHSPEALFIGPTMFEFNPTTLQTRIEASLSAERSIAEAVWYDGSIYIFGGFFQSIISSNIFKYTPSTQEFEMVGDLPTQWLPGNAAVLIGSKAYLFGGFSGPEAYLENVMVVDMETLAVTQEPIVGLDNAGFYLGSVAYVPELQRIYVIGGFRVQEVSNEIFYFQL